MRILFLLLTFSPALFAQTIPAYDRDDWNHWIDNDTNCRDTRQELLIRESLVSVTYIRRDDRRKCTVAHGRWHGQYIGQVFTAAGSMDLDHFIPLQWAHIHGGHAWNEQEKETFANDFENLILVDAGANRSKGARSPADWMPINDAFHCRYVAQSMAIFNRKVWTGTK